MESKPVHPTYALIDPFLKPNLRALELGCGIGHGVIHMLERGLKVTAVDVNLEALEKLEERLPEGIRATLVQSDFRALNLHESEYDIVIAGFSLFFLPPDDFKKFWPSVVGTIQSGGLFMGQFLGKNDDWAERNYTSQTSDQVKSLLQGFELLHFEEAERDGATAQGTAKHWHVFHVLARKG